MAYSNDMILRIKPNHNRYKKYNVENNEVEVESVPRGGSHTEGIGGSIFTITTHGRK